MTWVWFCIFFLNFSSCQNIPGSELIPQVFTIQERPCATLVLEWLTILKICPKLMLQLPSSLLTFYCSKLTPQEENLNHGVKHSLTDVHFPGSPLSCRHISQFLCLFPNFSVSEKRFCLLILRTFYLWPSTPTLVSFHLWGLLNSEDLTGKNPDTPSPVLHADVLVQLFSSISLYQKYTKPY